MNSKYNFESGFNYTNPFSSANPMFGVNWDAVFNTPAYKNYVNRLNMNEANRFSEYMDSTKYQRSVNDMISAGINPVVAFANGAYAQNSTSSVSPESASTGKTLLDKFISTALLLLVK